MYSEPNQDNKDVWTGFFERKKGEGARESLIKGLEVYFGLEVKPEELVAIDLGCGTGRDALPMLEFGFKVLAVDYHEESCDYVRGLVPEELQGDLKFLCKSFEDMELPKSHFINASFSLPFTPPEHFEAVWDKVVDAIVPNGLFVGQLFGDRDSWRTEKPFINFFTRDVAEALFAKRFNIIEFDEWEEEGMAMDKPKHWHAYTVIAQKI